MKKQNIITTLLLATLTLASCQRNDDLREGLRRQVQITATIEGQGAGTRAQLNNDGSGSLENGDRISLIYANATLPPPLKPQLVDYTIGATNLYWNDVLNKTSGTVAHRYAFRAWYPRFVFEDFERGETAYDVAGATDDTHRDFLMAKPVWVEYGKPVAFTFRHVMHKLTVKLKSDDYTAEQFRAAEVRLIGFKTHAKVNFNESKAKEDGASGSGEYPTAKGASVSFIVAPQDLMPGKRMLSIGIGDETFVYKVPPLLPGCKEDEHPCRLQSGKAFTLVLYLSKQSNTATLIEGNVSAWEDQGTISGTIGDNSGGAAEEQFTDPNFKAYVLGNFDTDKDGIISAEEASKVIQIGVSRKEIKNLKGIEIFTRLQGLDCDNNQLTDLDLSKNTGLQVLSCDNNRLTELDLSKNTGLETLVCNENQLTALDLSKNTGLQALNCNRNQLTALNLSKNTGLKMLSCGNNRLTALDITATQLLILWCGDQQNGQQLQLTLGNDHNRKRWKEQWKREGHRTVTAKDE